MQFCPVLHVVMAFDPLHKSNNMTIINFDNAKDLLK